MKAIKSKIVYYTYYGTEIAEVFCKSIREALAKAKLKRDNLHFYCYAIYNRETGGLIKEGK